MNEPSLIAYSTIPDDRRPRSKVMRIVRWLAAGLFWTWLGGVMVAGSAMAVGHTIGVLLGAITPIGTILLLVAGATLARGVRRIRDLSVLHYLEHAVRLDAPLPAMIAAAEQSERGAVRLGLRQLRRRLAAGDAVSTALSNAAPGLSGRMIGLLMAGENTGQMPASMRRIIGRRRFLPGANPTDAIFNRWYPLIVLTGLFAGTQAFLVFIAPKLNFRLWSRGMGTFVDIRLLQAFADTFGYVIFTIAGLGILILCGRMVAQLFTPRGMTLGPLSKAADAAAWYMPLAGVAVRSRALGDVCYVIAHALGAGMAANLAIVESATACGNIILERRLRLWTSEMLAGDSLDSAARKAGLPALLCDMLSTAGTDSDAQEVFEFLYRYYDSRFSRAALLLRGAIVPAVAIVGGIIVLSVALVVFQPLTALMNRYMQLR